MGDFFEGLLCLFLILVSICYAFSPTPISGWADNSARFNFFSEGDTTVDEIVMISSNGEEKIIAIIGDEKTMFLNDDLEIASPENSSWKIIFPYGNRFVVYDR